MFAAANLNKRSVTLELSEDAGRDLLLRMVERADVVLENYSARVVEQSQPRAHAPGRAGQRKGAHSRHDEYTEQPQLDQAISPPAPRWIPDG